MSTETSRVVTFTKSAITEELIDKMALNERQKKAIEHIKEHGKITNKEHQEINETTKKTATRDLDDLTTKKLVAKHGTTGRGVYYTLNGTLTGTKET